MSVNIDVKSFCTSYCEVFDWHRNKLSNATGFFYKRTESATYFVTNWHVVTGRDTSRPSISATGAIPVELSLAMHRRFADDIFRVDSVSTMYLTINDESGNAPRWMEHPEFRERIDVVVIEIDKEHPINSDEVRFYCINEIGLWPDYQPKAMQDVFVVGFPWGLHAGGKGLPIFKRGSLASEPMISAHNLPRMLIDCRTAKGMSGAPVLGVDAGPWDHEGIMIGSGLGFLGIYSGRLELDCLETSDIGVVWRSTLIDEIIEGRKLGRRLNELAE